MGGGFVSLFMVIVIDMWGYVDGCVDIDFYGYVY